MKRIIAYCGLICNDCPALIATNENDQEKKIELAHQWSNESYKVAPDEINCSGCTTGCNNIFKFCRECDIRLCGVEKEIENCAHCSEYPCNKLDKLFEMSPQNKILLDEVRSNLLNNNQHK